MHQSPNGEGQKRNSAVTDMELRRQLLSCMAETLTSQQYQAFVLNFLEGMSQKEIAIEFGVSGAAVSKMLSAAKRRLRRALGYTFEVLEDDFPK